MQMSTILWLSQKMKIMEVVTFYVMHLKSLSESSQETHQVN